MQEERFVKGTFPSVTGQKLDWRLWRPEGRPRAIVQLVHGTAEHIEALRRLGITPIHRKSFEPVKTMIYEGW